jgi:hypothetical protein
LIFGTALKTYSVGKIPSFHYFIRCPILFTQPRGQLARWRVLFLPTMQKPHYQSDSEPNQEDGTARKQDICRQHHPEILRHVSMN